jgi:hypothetical protein
MTDDMMALRGLMEKSADAAANPLNFRPWAGRGQAAPPSLSCAKSAL